MDGPRSAISTGGAPIPAFIQRIPPSLREHVIASTGEFFGTVLFLVFGMGAVQVANGYSDGGLPDLGILMYISVAFGLSLAVNAWVFYRISGGLFNPAVTLGMVVAGALPAVRGLYLLGAQVLGGIVASALVAVMTPGRLNVSTALSAETGAVQGMFLEAVMTFQLVFTIFMLAAEKHRATPLAPVGIGLALFIAEMTGVRYTGGSLNPARSLGPQVILREFPGSHWIYWAGPAIGAVAAAMLYKFMKILQYESANPDQDKIAPTTEGAIRLGDDSEGV